MSIRCWVSGWNFHPGKPHHLRPIQLSEFPRSLSLAANQTLDKEIRANRTTIPPSMLSRDQTFLGRKTYLGTRSTQNFLHSTTFLATSSISRVGSLPALMHAHNESRAQLQAQMAMLRDLQLSLGVCWSLALLQLGLQLLATTVQTMVQTKIRDLSLKQWQKWVKNIFGDEGFKVDQRTGDKVVLTMEELITKFGISKVKEEHRKELRRFFEEVSILSEAPPHVSSDIRVHGRASLQSPVLTFSKTICLCRKQSGIEAIVRCS